MEELKDMKLVTCYHGSVLNIQIKFDFYIISPRRSSFFRCEGTPLLTVTEIILDTNEYSLQTRDGLWRYNTGSRMHNVGIFTMRSLYISLCLGSIPKNLFETLKISSL